MCELNPQGYTFTGVFRELAKRKAEAIYNFNGVLEVMRIRNQKCIEAKKMAYPFCRQSLISDIMGYLNQHPHLQAAMGQSAYGLGGYETQRFGIVRNPIGRY